MSEKVIRITSQQGFSAEWLNAATPQTLNLCDFTMNSGLGVIDMSKSYIAFNSLISNPAETVNAGFFLQTNGDTDQYNVPTSALIRNCSIQSANVGQLESIRRQDTLGISMFGLTHTAEEKKSDMNVLSAYNDGRGVDQYTTYGLESVINNVSPDGAVIDTLDVSRNINRDLKVPLKDIFGVGAVEDFDLSKWGETRISLQTNFQQLKSHQWGGQENIAQGFNAATPQGAMVDMAAIATGATNQLLIQTEISYGEWEFTFPFFVNQTILCSATASAGDSPVDVERTIKSIQFQRDNTATPATDPAKVFITLDAAFYTNNTAAPAANVDLSDILFKAKVNDATLLNTINSAELVLFTRNDLTSEDTANEYDYTTFSTEEDNGNGIANFNRSYMLEPECENFIVAMPNDNGILPMRDMLSYRYAIDNVEQTGNRDIGMATGGAGNPGSSLQYERLIRALDIAMKMPFRNAQLKFYNQIAAQADAYDASISVIVETTKKTNSHKMLNLTITSAGLQQLILFYNQIAALKV
tara:strand:- start:1781 stop:3361 length:1581 start_codon:yes stop_codon:yes gene_type:complete